MNTNSELREKCGTGSTYTLCTIDLPPLFLATVCIAVRTKCSQVENKKDNTLTCVHYHITNKNDCTYKSQSNSTQLRKKILGQTFYKWVRWGGGGGCGGMFNNSGRWWMGSNQRWIKGRKMKVRGREGKLIQPGLQCGKKKRCCFFCCC